MLLFPPLNFRFASKAVTKLHKKREEILLPFRDALLDDGSSEEQFIRIGMDFLVNPRYDPTGIILEAPRYEFVGVVDKDYGKFHKVVAYARTLVENAISELSNFKMVWDRSSVMSTASINEQVYGICCWTSECLQNAMVKCFQLGSYTGHEEGKRLLTRLYGDLPRSARRYAFEVCDDIGTGTPEHGVNHRTLSIRVETTKQRDKRHNEYCASLEKFFPILTEEIFRQARSKAALAGRTIQDFHLDGPEGNMSVEQYYDDQSIMVEKMCNQERMTELLNDLEEVFTYVYRMGEDAGFESGQTWLKREYGFFPKDSFVYSFIVGPTPATPTEGIKISRHPAECDCKDCPLCLFCT